METETAKAIAERSNTGLVASIFDSPLYSKHGFMNKIIHLIFRSELLVAEKHRDLVIVVREKDVKSDTEEK